MGKAEDAPQSSTQRPFNEYEDLPPAYDAPSASSAKPHMPARPPQHHAPGPVYGQSSGPSQYPQYPPYAPHPRPFPYPPGYFCQYCRNTGIKPYNNSPCGTCERMFGIQHAQVQHLPAFAGVPMGAPVYIAGDPRLGGRLCGNCKGYGTKQAIFGLVEEQCRVCRGVGRIL